MRFVLAALVLGFFCIPSGAQWKPEDMNRTIDDTNFLVNRGCSGTLIDLKSRLILTAEHCVDSQYETIEREKISDEGVVTKEKIRRLLDGTVSRIVFQGATSVTTVTYKVKLLATDKSKDLALVQIKDTYSGRRAAPIACANPVRGETVYIVGNPMGSLYSSVTVGVVSSVQRDYGLLGVDNTNQQQALMQVSGGVVGGNSGGAAYNASGEIVGVPVLGHRTNEVLAFAAPLSAIKEFLAANKFGGLFEHCENAP
jgi:S1-C subfamily serine protease